MEHKTRWQKDIRKKEEKTDMMKRGIRLASTFALCKPRKDKNTKRQGKTAGGQNKHHKL